MLHCFQKKTQATSKHDKDIAEVRYRAVISMRKGRKMKIDTEIRHVTRPGANLFLELGFKAEEAERLHQASQKQINDTRLLKEQLMMELAGWIAQHHLKQAEAARILMVSRPRISDVINKKTTKFTIDTLVEMLSRIGKPVRLAVD